jgi:pre-mRNA-splicing factor 38A
VRILGAFYLRLVGKPTDVYQYLEPLYNDYRKLRRKLADGGQYMSFQPWFVGTLESGIDVVY